MPHDIFISYAHSDDEIPTGCSAGWVSTFVTELRKVLRRRIGGTGADIWMDHRLASNEQVSPTLQEKAASSRTLILFLSNGYLNSNWCRSELNDFLQANAAHKNRESVFVVEIDRIDRSRWPARLRELTPVCLYEVDTQSQIPQLIGFPVPQVDSRSPYWFRLNTLAHLACEHLGRLKERSIVPEPQDPKTLCNGTVWIASPPLMLVEHWESLASALRQEGASVRPLGRASYTLGDASSFGREVKTDLNQSALWVQLLAAEAGPPVANGAQSTCAVQSLLARAALATGSEVRFLQWRPPGIDLATLRDGEYRRLIEGTIASGFEAFRMAVLDAYKGVSQERNWPRQRTREANQPLQLCVTAGPSDEPHGTAVCKIVESMGHGAIPVSASPLRGQSPSDFREQFENILSLVDGAILVNGAVPSSWVQSRYVQLLKLAAGRRPWGALLDAPGASTSPTVFGRAQFEQLNCRNGIHREPIEHFLMKLREVRAGA